MDKSKRVSDLMQKGFALLDEHRYEDARKVGHMLKKLRHSSAFEILALAYLRSDKLPKAIGVLEEGVTKAERVWILWELLGNCYSDAGRYSKAEQAYQQALRLENCDRDVVQLNRAIAFHRARKHRRAKDALRFVTSPRLRRLSDAWRIRTALTLKEVRSARQLAFRLSRTRPTREEKHDRASESQVLLSCALALESSSSTKARARRLAYRAVEMHPNSAEALALIREIPLRKAADLMMLRLIIRGVWNVPIDDSKVPPGFFQTFEIAATSERTAFQHARPFFPKAVRKSLCVEQTETLNGNVTAVEGVYFLSGYIFYPRRSKR